VLSAGQQSGSVLITLRVVQSTIDLAFPDAPYSTNQAAVRSAFCSADVVAS
jgi:hypothetical protein